MIGFGARFASLDEAIARVTLIVTALLQRVVATGFCVGGSLAFWNSLLNPSLKVID